MKKFLFVMSLIASAQASAFFCPNSFNQIDYGNTTDQVLAACGAPDFQATTKEATATPEEWTYYINPVGSQPAGVSFAQKGSTVKLTIAFDADQKVVNVTLSTQTLGNAPVCNNNVIRVGYTQQQVKALCGAPQYINKGEVPQGDAKEQEVTRFKYNTNPPVTLIFENGKLTQRK